MGEIDDELLRAVAKYLKRVERLAASEQIEERTKLGSLLSEHLGVDAATVPIVTEQIAAHRLVDADLALEALTSEHSGRVIGVTGGEQRFHSSLAELITNPYTPFTEGPVSYEARATGPASERRVVSFGIRLLQVDGTAIAIVQRGPAPQHGRVTAQLELLCADENLATATIARIRELMIEHSVLRGKVLSFVPNEYGQHAGASFLVRPELPAEAIVLGEGVLESVVDHVVGIGEHREALVRAGQHLKRGVLLYGPPGTGKTLTVRHLLARTPNTTAIVLTGSSIAFIAAAAEIARTFQPALVVLEDIDLVAMERAQSPQPLLFEVLDALDGLDTDADVAFVMTTNRVQVLERALATRPGRVDLGVEIALPDAAARRRLFRRYAGDLPFSAAALDGAADRAEDTTGSFAKELMRRAVLAAALRGEGELPDDDDLSAALGDLLSSGAALTRLLLGGRSAEDEGEDGTQTHSDGSYEAF